MRRPDLLAAEALLSAANARVGVAEANRYQRYPVGHWRDVDVRILTAGLYTDVNVVRSA